MAQTTVCHRPRLAYRMGQMPGSQGRSFKLFDLMSQAGGNIEEHSIPLGNKEAIWPSILVSF